MIATYLQDYEKKNYTSIDDKELNELFQKVRNKFPDKFYVQKTDVVYKKFFKKRVKVFYSIYYNVNDPEYQCINFYGGDNSICTNIDGSVLYAFFMGLLNNEKPTITKDNFFELVEKWHDCKLTGDQLYKALFSSNKT